MNEKKKQKEKRIIKREIGKVKNNFFFLLFQFLFQNFLRDSLKID